MTSVRCPLCESSKTSELCRTSKPYVHCLNCELVFVPKEFHLSHADEKTIYEHHENNPEDQGYRTFLSRLMTPLLDYLPESGSGLDFGCGPGPTLSVMLEEQGYHMATFDPYFANDPAALEKKYDFVTTTEVVEHLSSPKEVFAHLFDLIKPGGVIGVMTKLIPTLDNFEKWHYIKDPTHITFYAPKTFEFIAQQFGYEAKVLRNDVIILIPTTKA